MCFKGFFVKNFTIAFCMWGCCALSAMPAAEPVACIPAINGCVLSPVNDSLHLLLLLTISLQHPRKSSFFILRFFSPLLSQLTWIGFNNNSIFWTANINFLSVQHCRFDNFGSFAPSEPNATTFSSSSCRCWLRLHLIAVFVDVFAFISVSSSWSSSPSSPSRCLGRLRLHLRLVVFAVFVYAITLSPASPSPFTREFTVDRRSGIVLFCILTRWLPPRLRPIFVVACRDRPQWPSPQGALGNAPVGTSLCRCGGGFLRVCIPCNGFRHHVSPDLSSDKSHLVRDPYDAMRSNCSLSNLRVAWPGSQRGSRVDVSTPCLY
ncbi:hypothetical protein OUZ56_013268 [Daphnia magna]|uniref:Secreted protein n=1 Tax=Daphnia magna TaxID=35525 RepID=A0ABQ9Z5E1_9CRUS|nr:hypothetical protein OUZ56_013268 [Daphnia magna]